MTPSAACKLLMTAIIHQEETSAGVQMYGCNLIHNSCAADWRGRAADGSERRCARSRDGAQRARQRLQQLLSLKCLRWCEGGFGMSNEVVWRFEVQLCVSKAYVLPVSESTRTALSQSTQFCVVWAF